MVSTIMLARLHTGRLSTNISQAAAGNNPESTSSASSSSKYLSYGTLNSAVRAGLSSKNLSALLAQLQQTTSTNASSTVEAPIAKLDSKQFMTALKKTIVNDDENAQSAAKSKAILAALKDGTLAVVDPFKGEKVNAWDPTSKDATAGKTEKVTKATWSAFLNEHLKKDSNGAFLKLKDGAYVDAKTGENAYFTKVNGRDYYLTWPTGITIMGEDA